MSKEVDMAVDYEIDPRLRLYRELVAEGVSENTALLLALDWGIGLVDSEALNAYGLQPEDVNKAKRAIERFENS